MRWFGLDEAGKNSNVIHFAADGVFKESQVECVTSERSFILGTRLLAGSCCQQLCQTDSLLFFFAAAAQAQIHCGQWDTQVSGPYTLYNNLWGKDGATSGGQCSQIDSLSGTTVAWTTNWTWTGGNGVKSFANIQLNGVNRQLSSVKSMTSTWTWSYSSSSIVADVAWDFFSSSTSGGSHAYEIMIWLAAYGGAGPISSQYDSTGKPVAVGMFAYNGITYNLYSGTNSGWKVLSFLPSRIVTSFSGDLMDFFNFLTSHGYMSASQYLTILQAGTEPTSGRATLTTSRYSVSLV